MTVKLSNSQQSLLNGTTAKSHINNVCRGLTCFCLSRLSAVLPCLIVSGLALTFPAKAAERYVGDWFETEVILFSQLDDKEKLKEVFSKEFPLPDYSNVIDLLSAYLNPDIASLKQQLPSCDTPQYPENFVKQALTKYQQETKLINALKSLTAIESMALPMSDELAASGDALGSEPLSTNPTPALIADNEPEFALVQENNVTNNITSSQDALTYVAESDAELQIDNPESIAYAPLTEAQIALVAQAKQFFSKQQLNSHYASVVTTNLCVLNEAQYQSLDIDNSRYSYLGFTVNKMPGTIDAAEDIYSEVPYLISKESLQLKDIMTQLRRSKNFKPLLHLGWRQQVFDPKQSVPLKLFAGDNLTANYQAANAYYQQQKQRLVTQEAELANILSDNQASLSDQDVTQPSAQELLAVAKQQRLQRIIEQIDNLNNKEQVIEELAQDLSIEDSTGNALMSAPAPPVQPWYIDGFVKLHILENYLNITVDFNILNLTLAQQETLQLNNVNRGNAVDDVVKRIRLQQHRRVISSEIHYFDHPYMGMIIQIRKHKQSQPEVEATEEIEESQ